MNDYATEVLQRLPELLWKLNQLGGAFNSRAIPPGVFNCTGKLTPRACIGEIKADLLALNEARGEKSMTYLAQGISTKITLLTRLCRLHERGPLTLKPFNVDLKTICTRQQWLDDLQAEILILSEQEQALAKKLEQFQQVDNVQAALSLQAEVGRVRQQLTTNQEAWAKISS